MRPHRILPLAGALLLGLATVAVAKPERAEKSDLAEKMRKSPSAAPSGSSSVRSIEDEVGETFRKHRPKPAEIEAKLAELRATHAERRAAHLAAIKTRFSGPALHDKALVAELRAHARRLAFLSRAKFIASTQLDEPRRGATLTRIDKLMTRENERHERKVQKIKQAIAAPNASGVPSAAPAPSGSAP
jgi:hypothetical protein